MIHMTKAQLTTSLTALLFAFSLAGPLLVDDADARSRGGGRSFSRSKSTPSKPPQRATQSQSKPSTNAPGLTGSSFMRGLGGGLLGGFLGSMLFGGMGHAGGMSGVGGSGIGLFEILIFGGIAYFLFRKFARRQKPSPQGTQYGSAEPDYSPRDDEKPRPIDTRGMAFSTAGPERAGDSHTRNPDFDPEAFKEFAQDVFFKIQAAWARRDITVMAQYLGQDLLKEYEGHFEELKKRGEINRLENIAVRKVEIEDSGEMDGEEFVIVRFTANLLDYTVEESTGKVVKGDPAEPVKFDEKWAFSRPEGSSQWKLEGIQ
jgi:predicted lipid-binding transport protein (Tim44 family)